MNLSQQSDQSVKVRPARESRRSFWLQYLSLFSSLGTLLCCALPSVLVLFGLGATVASVLSSAPWLVALSRHKNWTFAIAGLLIASNFVYVYGVAPRLRTRTEQCAPGEEACVATARISTAVLWVSAAVYVIGFFVAYVLGPIFVWIDRSG